MIVGVLIIVGDSIGTGALFGDLMALCSALLLASAITVSRASGKDMGFTALIGVVFPFAVAVVMVGADGLQRRRAVVDHLQRRGRHADLVLLPGHRTALHFRAGSGDVLPAGNGAGADLGVDDLFGGAVAATA